MSYTGSLATCASCSTFSISNQYILQGCTGLGAFSAIDQQYLSVGTSYRSISASYRSIRTYCQISSISHQSIMHPAVHPISHSVHPTGCEVQGLVHSIAWCTSMVYIGRVYWIGVSAHPVCNHLELHRGFLCLHILQCMQVVAELAGCCLESTRVCRGRSRRSRPCFFIC